MSIQIFSDSMTSTENWVNRPGMKFFLNGKTIFD